MTQAHPGRPWPVGVLICSADRTLSDLVARNLDRRAFRVRQAPLAPLDVTTMLPGETPDIVVADIDDGDPASWDHTAWLRAAFPYVSLVVLAHDWPVAGQLRRLQPCCYVRKPFSIDALLVACEAARPAVT